MQPVSAGANLGMDGMAAANPPQTRDHSELDRIRRSH